MKRYPNQTPIIKTGEPPSETYPYLRVAWQSIKDFEEDIRVSSSKYFNVLLFLEQEFSKHYVSHKINRKPPKAVTIEQWFNGNHISGSKMGTEDLKLICKFIKNPEPMIAYYQEAMDYLTIPKEEVTSKSLDENKKIKEVWRFYPASLISKIGRIINPKLNLKKTS
jgi:hypothetical protein